MGEGGARPTPKGLIRTLLLQPPRPSYSQAITLGGPSVGLAHPSSPRVIAPLPGDSQAQLGRVAELSTVINSE